MHLLSISNASARLTSSPNFLTQEASRQSLADLYNVTLESIALAVAGGSLQLTVTITPQDDSDESVEALVLGQTKPAGQAPRPPGYPWNMECQALALQWPEAAWAAATLLVTRTTPLAFFSGPRQHHRLH